MTTEVKPFVCDKCKEPQVEVKSDYIIEAFELRTYIVPTIFDIEGYGKIDAGKREYKIFEGKNSGREEMDGFTQVIRFKEDGLSIVSGDLVPKCDAKIVK